MGCLLWDQFCVILAVLWAIMYFIGACYKAFWLWCIYPQTYDLSRTLVCLFRTNYAIYISIHWRPMRVTVSLYHRQIDCYRAIKIVVKLKSKKISKLLTTVSLWGESTSADYFSSQKDNNTESFFMSRRHHGLRLKCVPLPYCLGVGIRQVVLQNSISGCETESLCFRNFMIPISCLTCLDTNTPASEIVRCNS